MATEILAPENRTPGMTWLELHRWYVVAACCVIVAAVWVQAVRVLAGHRADQAEMEADLDAIDPAKVPVLRPADLGRPEAVPGAWLAAGTPAVPAADDGAGAVDGGPAAVLTARQRRRAIHKGRIPHPQNLPPVKGVMPHGTQHVAAEAHINLPGPAANRDSESREPVRIGADNRAGELHHPRHERLVDVKADTANWLRYDDYQKFWDALWQDRRDAYDAWEAGFARLESVRWLDLAA
jgi:hypothetical protein